MMREQVQAKQELEKRSLALGLMEKTLEENAATAKILQDKTDSQNEHVNPYMLREQVQALEKVKLREQVQALEKAKLREQVQALEKVQEEVINAFRSRGVKAEAQAVEVLAKVEGLVLRLKRRAANAEAQAPALQAQVASLVLQLRGRKASQVSQVSQRCGTPNKQSEYLAREAMKRRKWERKRWRRCSLRNS
jgi:hypothetical protein